MAARKSRQEHQAYETENEVAIVESVGVKVKIDEQV